MPSQDVAEKYAVSRAWVDRLKQRRRETGEITPRRQTRWRTPILHAQLDRVLWKLAGDDLRERYGCQRHAGVYRVSEYHACIIPRHQARSISVI